MIKFPLSSLYSLNERALKKQRNKSAKNNKTQLKSIFKDITKISQKVFIHWSRQPSIRKLTMAAISPSQLFNYHKVLNKHCDVVFQWQRWEHKNEDNGVTYKHNTAGIYTKEHKTKCEKTLITSGGRFSAHRFTRKVIILMAMKRSTSEIKSLFLVYTSKTRKSFFSLSLIFDASCRALPSQSWLV